MTPAELDAIRARALTDSPFDEGRDAYNDRDALLEEVDRLTAAVEVCGRGDTCDRYLAEHPL